MTTQAVKYCRELGKPSEQTAKTLRKLFPACSSFKKATAQKRKFDPKAECVAITQKRKKKAANIRIIPRIIPDAEDEVCTQRVR